MGKAQQDERSACAGKKKALKQKRRWIIKNPKKAGIAEIRVSKEEDWPQIRPDR